MNESEVETIAAALFNGGWRSGDKKSLIAEYSLTDEEAETVCKQFERWE